MDYIKLRSAISEAEQEHGIHTLDCASREMLHRIARANMANRSIKITDLAKAQDLRSFPSVLRRVKKLVDEGWINRKGDPHDARAVLLEITPKTISIFKKISNALDSL